MQGEVSVIAAWLIFDPNAAFDIEILIHLRRVIKNLQSIQCVIEIPDHDQNAVVPYDLN